MAEEEQVEPGMAGNTSSAASKVSSSLVKLQSLHGMFAIYKKKGPTSADVLNALKEALLKGNQGKTTETSGRPNKAAGEMCFLIL